MGTEVLPPDLEAWACDYARALLASRTVATIPDLSTAHVGNKWPDEGEFPAVAVIFRDDGGRRTSLVSGVRSLGVTVLAGSRRYDSPARDLARMLLGAFSDESLPMIGGPDCPVASVDDSFGPYSVPEAQDRSAVYFSVEYTVVGTPVG